MTSRWANYSLKSLTGRQNGHISFDPLGVAAVLHNPRAVSSTARLYSQCEPGVPLWTHTLMLGGALIPFKALALHLLPSPSGNHPAMEMFSQATYQLQARTNFGFDVLPMDPSNYWVEDALSSTSKSERPQHDIFIFRVPDRDSKAASYRLGPAMIIVAICLLIGAIATTGLWYSISIGDIWGVSLFASYASHWVASILVGMIHPVRIQDVRIQLDDTPVYALYKRPIIGGMIIFMGRKDALETWARRTWRFHYSFMSTVFHWMWVLTGSACATASLASMVNMESGNQLVFLALLLCSSFGEIAATRATAWARVPKQSSNGSIVLANNDYRTTSIIRATLELPLPFRLKGIRWIADADMLPDQPIFREMQTLLESIGSLDVHKDWDMIQGKLKDYVNKFPTGREHSVATRIQQEVNDALLARA